MAAHDNLSPDQFASHMASINSEVMARHQAKRDSGQWSERLPRPDTLFHGTAAALGEGDKLVSGRPSNYPGHTLDTQALHVYATGRLETAYSAGMKAAQVKEVQEEGDYYGPITTSHVYEVHSTGRLAPDPEFDKEDMSFRSRQPFKVGREVSRGAKREYINTFGGDWEGD